jgi:dTDP-4-dehydrorhamnose reductase
LIPQRNNQSNYEYIRVNSEFPHLLNGVSQKYNCHFIHITTDCVFDGSKGKYIETDHHTENGIYGHSKSLGEPLSATVLRTSIIGEEVENKKSLLEWVKSQNGNRINGFVNHYWNGVTCLQLAKIVQQIISQNLYWQGVRHIFSPTYVSKFELVKMISDIYKLQIEIIPLETKVCDKTLSSKYNIFVIPELYEQIQELCFSPI